MTRPVKACNGTADMQAISRRIARRRVPSTRHVLLLAVRTAAILSMSFGAAFGFLAAMQSPGAHYDPHNFAIGAAALFGAACGAIGLLISRNRQLRAELRSREDTIEDLSDRNWELKESEERAKNFLEAQGDVIVRTSGDDRITYVNDAYCALAGRIREQLIGTDFKPPLIEQGDFTLSADGTRNQDQKIATPGGSRWIAWREVVVRDGKKTETQSVGRDVTDRVEAERALSAARDHAEAASRAKSRFLAMISHEIRTPLNGILGMTGLLLDTALSPEQSTYATAVKTSGETLLSLIEDVLDFSKIEAGRLDLDAKPFDLPALVEETIELVAPRAQAKDIEIASYVDDSVPRNVVGDAARVRQVLLNLVGNAIKFTERGGVTVVVERGSDGIRFLVCDTGIGVAPEEQERIFREFEQAETGSPRKSGTGLGLAISRRIVERMGGRIGVYSTLGAGSTFHVSIPLARAPAMDETAFTPPNLAGMDVLIVAPTTIESSVVARRLMQWGAKTCVVQDEKVALLLLDERAWNAILVDHMLGATACERLARATAEIARRIVLITPTARPELPALKDAGFTGYLVKPVRTASLAAQLDGEHDGFERLAGDADTATALDIPATNEGGLAILVAEDNEINALLTDALLKRLGHRPTVVPNGETALAAWLNADTAGAPYDLVLMDLHMPGSDGIAAARSIRAIEAERGTRRTPIIALTANALEEDRDACIAAGMDGFLTKPLDRQRLAAALTELLARASLAA